MSVINNTLVNFKIFYVNFSNNLKSVFNTLLGEEKVASTGSFVLRGPATTEEAIKMLATHEKKMIIVNFTHDLKEAFSFVVEIKFGKVREVQDTEILMLGTMEKNYSDFSSLEGAVSGFVSLPIVKKNLVQSLTNMCLDIMRPPPYDTILGLSRDFISDKNYDVAETLLTKASKLHPRPAQAMYYLGKLDEDRGNFGSAFKKYVGALKANKNHYITLRAMFRVLIAQKRIEDAIKVLKKMFAAFPTPSVVVSTFVESFELEKKPQAILLIDQNIKDFINDENKQAIRAAFHSATAATFKALVKAEKYKEASGIFGILINYAPEPTNEILELKTTVIEKRLGNFYLDIWPLIPSKIQNKAKIIEAQAEIVDKACTRDTALKTCQELVKGHGAGVQMVYEVLIRKASEAGLDRVAERAIEGAIERWPDQAIHFRSLTKIDVKKGVQ